MRQLDKNLLGYYLGTMTGTSGDGLDVSLIEIDESENVKFVTGQTFKYGDNLRKNLISLSSPTNNEIELMGECDTELGQFTGESILDFLHNIGRKKETIIALGSHGQTIRHRPPSTKNRFPFTIQIGNPHLIADITSITTIADFRRRDMAAGGQGAPLVPPFHFRLFQKTKEHQVVILNIGGISNITVLGRNLLGFDTGPGNCLMDAWILKHQNKYFDAEGTWASQGKVIQPLLNNLIEDTYFANSYPKSTGREYFNIGWAQEKYDKLNSLNKMDVQATFCELTVITVISALEKLDSQTHEIIVCGGGRLNTHLMNRLKEKAACPVTVSEDYSIDGDYLEASAFAWLAFKHLKGETASSPMVTGAKGARLLGTLFPPN